MVWNDKTQTLTIGKSKGTFPGMLSKRVFNIVRVDKSNGMGIAPAGKTRAVNYSGERIAVKL
jgi:alpha-D-xyloside xylohydrolase